MKTIRLLCIYLLFPICLFAQSKSELDSLYQEARRLANENSNESIELCSQIKEASIGLNYSEMEVKSYYLLGFNYYLKGEAENVYKNSNKAIELAEKIRYNEGKALALRLLGTQYAKLGLLNQSKNKLEEALQTIQKVNSEEANEIRGLIYNSFLVLMNDNEEIDHKIIVARKAIQEYEKLNDKNRRDGLLVSAYTNLGYLYGKVNKFDSAQWAFRESLHRNSQNDYYLNAAIYHDIAHTLQNEGKTDSAISNYLKALEFCKGRDFAVKKLEILNGLYESYQAAGDESNYIKYFREHTALQDSLNEKNASAIDAVVTDSEKNNLKIRHQNKFIKNTTILLGILFLGLIIWTIYIVFNKRKQKKKFNEIIAKLKSEKNIENRNLTEHSKVQENSNLIILEETEQRILKCLAKFEKGTAFNHSETSLYNLANQINTNTKYLSEVIKKHKNKNFNTYINELRINYIVEKLQNEPQYLNYKISHLAEETGFSSHSAFSSIFSQVMGISPSSFIRYLKKESN